VCLAVRYHPLVTSIPSEKVSLHQHDKLIVALDVAQAASAHRLISTLGHQIHFYKIGLQLFIAEGPALVQEISRLGKQVFLDLKLHDIPNTVAAAVASIGSLNVRMLTVHAAGGVAMLQAATEAAASLPSKPLVLAVTVLTSLSDQDLADGGIGSSTQDHAVRLAQIAKRAGCGGVVASPQEIRALRQAIGTEMTIVTPGVRPHGAAAGDQRRIATPEAAIEAGADYVVVGRPITAAPDPANAARAILASLSQQAKSRP
jgi:orotidine-5'-phosphate decarboxylase